MKKILLGLTVLSILLLGACSSAPSDTLIVDVEDTRLEELEQRIIDIEFVLDNLGILEGLNGQKDYYIIPQENTVNSLYQSVSAATEYLATELDKTKLPQYLFDADTGDALEFNDVGSRLKLKYFNETSTSDYFKVGFQTKMRMKFTNELTINEFMARLILMVEELENYTYWLIGGSELYLQIELNGVNFEIFIYMPSLLSEGFALSPSDYYHEQWEIELTNITFNLEQTQTYYDNFIADEVFINYVLDYN